MRHPTSLLVVPALLAITFSSCSSPPTLEPQEGLEPSAPPSGPYVLVLGTAQDGGIPHLGCYTGNCAAARENPLRRRFVTSILLCDPRDGRRWLFDCTPDLIEQMGNAEGHPSTRKTGGAVRPPLCDGIFLTHAHMGHYAGLLELGREAYVSKELPTYCTSRFGEFLTKNGPWSLLVEEKRIVLNELKEGAKVELAPDLSVVPFKVPHRDEFSDTVGFEIHGPDKTLVYLPDIDKWEKWDRRIEDVIAGCDFALLDGCFFADGEVRGRSMKDIPHPFIVESIERFGPLPLQQRTKVWFTHLNHTNPAADDHTDARQTVIEASVHVLDEGRMFAL
jgi:pyrroloquinoline quinone biosynthesis protein B